ncbi:MAG: hypothetical protein JOY69_09895, partial [Candidatus Eremiobacteraeota bacterium]|nr:hypothetical protein [Candidatus Eremiobacteraeota bacterium]
MFSSAFAAVAFALVVAANAPALPVVIVAAPKAQLRLEVATTPTQQEHGLMGR